MRVRCTLALRSSLPGDPGGWLTCSLYVSPADHGQAQPPLHCGCKHRLAVHAQAQRHIFKMVSAPPPRLSLSAPGSPTTTIFPPRAACLSLASAASSAEPTRMTSADCLPPQRMSRASLQLRALCPGDSHADLSLSFFSKPFLTRVLRQVQRPYRLRAADFVLLPFKSQGRVLSASSTD